MAHGNTIYPREPPTDHRIKVGERVVYFAFGYLFGPRITDGYGNSAKRQPTSESSKFWPPFEAWLADYMKTNPPPETKP